MTRKELAAFKRLDKRRDPEKPKRKYDAKKRAPKLTRVEADA